MTPLPLAAEWAERAKRMAEAADLRARGAKIKAESPKIWADGAKRWFQRAKRRSVGTKLWADGYRRGVKADAAWQAAVVAHYGGDAEVELGAGSFVVGGHRYEIQHAKGTNRGRRTIAHQDVFGNGESVTDIDAQVRTMIERDNARMRDAGNKLAVAAVKVVNDFDGCHRLMLAVAEWALAVANEGDRPH